MATWARLLRDNKIQGKAFAGWAGREKNSGPKGEMNSKGFCKFWTASLGSLKLFKPIFEFKTREITKIRQGLGTLLK
jgi:hypothetical protein